MAKTLKVYQYNKVKLTSTLKVKTAHYLSNKVKSLNSHEPTLRPLLEALGPNPNHGVQQMATYSNLSHALNFLLARCY